MKMLLKILVAELGGGDKNFLATTARFGVSIPVGACRYLSVCLALFIFQKFSYSLFL